MTARTMLQFFHWYYPDGGRLWGEVADKATALADMGVTDIWLPPACKGASGGWSVGYDIYDLFDLGEFDQKGSVATKYGDRAGLVHAAQSLRDAGIGVIHDVVFNHKMGADEKERVQVRRADPENRTDIEDHVFEASAYTRFTFPGRNGQYSQFIWDMKCFSGIDHIEDPDDDGIFRLVNEYGDGEWNREVDDEKGNFDYLMGSDVEFRNNAVYEELKYWGRWLPEQVVCNGFRLDAAKHIPAWFFRDWVGHVRETVDSELFVVAEYWHPDMAVLRQYLDQVDKQLMLFDVALHHRFFEASKAGGDFDMRTIFDDTLVSALPDHAVTLVANHDTQPLQAMEASVEPWFKPLAYALILLREQGVPCLFYPDLYGARYSDQGDDGQSHEVDMPAIACLPRLVEVRKRFAHGPQTDLFDDPHCIAFVRHGTAEAPGCITILSNGEGMDKTVELGADHAGVRYRDYLGHCEEDVVADDHGTVTVRVNGGSVSVWSACDVG
ncbi:alpha-amylase [Sphingobium sp. HBC34]|uniref:Alpha-amylase n=1 Tax=Sphingobium cyanobacteriorum TaxID=3063954 RepID=A0ABT8ZLQ1_9SPHN|nr:alpha-amylase [Sphingobium sp. HBC34]MDO7835469.1 alpha-amylase [Sphingobium sp. HBC34]